MALSAGSTSVWNRSRPDHRLPSPDAPAGSGWLSFGWHAVRTFSNIDWSPTARPPILSVPGLPTASAMRRVRHITEDHVSGRTGAAVVDYFLGIGVVLPLLLFVIPAGRRAMQLVFDLTCTLVAWPFM
jgi:hypothetical protein